MKNQKIAVNLTRAQIDSITGPIKSFMQGEGIRGAEKMSIPAAIAAWDKQRPKYVEKMAAPRPSNSSKSSEEWRAFAADIRDAIDDGVGILKALGAAEVC